MRSKFESEWCPAVSSSHRCGPLKPQAVESLTYDEHDGLLSQLCKKRGGFSDKSFASFVLCVRVSEFGRQVFASTSERVEANIDSCPGA